MTPLAYQLRFVELGAAFYLKPPSHVSIPRNQNGTMAKVALLMEKFISAECVRWIRQKRGLCGLAACASSPGCNLELIGQHDLGRPMVERASISEGAHCCRRARVSQPNASGLQLARRIFCGRLSRYTFNEAFVGMILFNQVALNEVNE